MSEPDMHAQLNDADIVWPGRGPGLHCGIAVGYSGLGSTTRTNMSSGR